MGKVKEGFRSPSAQSIMRSGSSMENLEMAQAEERAHLPHARGRIMQGFGWMNSGGSINGARFSTWDPKRRVVTLRLDDTRIPAFWVTVEIPLDHLEAWIGERESEQMQED